MKWFASLLAVAALSLMGGVAHADHHEKSDGKSTDGFQPLFNGKDLEGWKANEHKETFSVKDGHIVVHGDRAHLFYEGPVHNHDWKDFHFKAMVMTKPQANSGIYFHTEFQDDGWPAKGFECQVNQTHGDPKKTGGLYAVKDVMNQSPAKDGEWYLYEIIVKGDHVELKINGKTTTDWTQPEGWKGGTSGFAGRKIGHGTFALQGHDPNSEVHFKDIMVKSLDDSAAAKTK